MKVFPVGLQTQPGPALHTAPGRPALTSPVSPLKNWPDLVSPIWKTASFSRTQYLLEAPGVPPWDRRAPPFCGKTQQGWISACPRQMRVTRLASAPVCPGAQPSQ